MARSLPHAIQIRGARTQNLKAIDVDIPYRQLTVITGCSGSGKSSLSDKTLFAESIFRYMEGFHTHERQLSTRQARPPVASMWGVLPSIKLDRKKAPKKDPNLRVGTITDLYAYLRLLFAKWGTTHSPISGERVQKHTVADVVAYLQKATADHDALLLAPAIGPWPTLLPNLLARGFTRLVYEGELHSIEAIIARNLPAPKASPHIVIDRLKNASATRMADSARTAFFEGRGRCSVQIGDTQRTFSDRFEADGITFKPPSPRLFDFRNPYGACPKCQGSGERLDLDPHKVIPDEERTIEGEAVRPWRGTLHAKWNEPFRAAVDFPSDRPYKELTQQQKQLLWEGNQEIKGIRAFFAWMKAQKSRRYRIIYAQYESLLPCSDCRASGLCQAVQQITIQGKTILDLLNTPIEVLQTFFQDLRTTNHRIARLLIQELFQRITYLIQTDLGYLTLNRKVHTLSGGEYQRIRLAKMLGAPLIDSLYIIDHPTEGLHPHHTTQLIEALLQLKELGNTVVVVSHDEAIIRAACHVIDLGPVGGAQGGHVCYAGPQSLLHQAPESYTAAYLSGRHTIPTPTTRNRWTQAITLSGLRQHNLKNISVTFPLGVLTTLSGVNGSGKSTLINTLYAAVRHALAPDKQAKPRGTLSGHIDTIRRVVHMEHGQHATDTLAACFGVHGAIYQCFAQAADRLGHVTSYFTVNREEGFCAACLGKGQIEMNMRFVEDIALPCATCQGKRFRKEVLATRYLGKNLDEVLHMSIKEALDFFQTVPITNRLKPLCDLGLHDLQLGQSLDTLSSGEVQRVKLATHLNPDPSHGHTLFIADEPTSNLHLHEIDQLRKAFHALVAQGHTVVVTEHNVELLKSADWLIDLGPSSGPHGGEVVFEGRPEALLEQQNNPTARFLRAKLKTCPTP